MTTDRQRVAREAANEISVTCVLSGEDGTLFDSDLATELILRALAHSEQGWVSVSEKLPVDVRLYEIVREWGGETKVLTDVWLGDERKWQTYLPETITYWRPMPAPPVNPESAQ